MKTEELRRVQSTLQETACPGLSWTVVRVASRAAGAETVSAPQVRAGAPAQARAGAPAQARVGAAADTTAVAGAMLATIWAGAAAQTPAAAAYGQGSPLQTTWASRLFLSATTATSAEAAASASTASALAATAASKAAWNSALAAAT